MKLLAEPLGAGRRVALIAVAATFTTLALLALASRAHASETVYWDNYSDSPNTISSANIDGSGGWFLSLGGLAFKTSEGMTYDPVTNRLYIAAESTATNEGEIVYVNLDGSGAGVLPTPGAEALSPEGVALDPSTRMIYWINTGNRTISWAKLDGSGGGTLVTTGAATESIGYRLAIDPASGRLYFSAMEGGEHVISYVNVNGTGGGVLPAAVNGLGSLNGLSTDPASGRLYMLGGSGSGALASVDLNGGIVSSASLGSAFKEGYGLAIDPALQKAYWGNYGNGNTQANVLGFASLAAGGEGTISLASAHANGAQDPVIIKSPTGTSAPQVTRSGAALSCSQGGWSADYPGGNVFSAPRSYAYQWLLNGQPVAGATASTYTATASGSYACAVTATNPSGSGVQTSAAVSVTIATPPTPASVTFGLASKKAVKVKAGKAAVVKVNLRNAGGTASGAVKVCGKLAKQAKKGLVAPKCVSVASVPANGGKVIAKLRVKTRKTAKGAYKLSVVVSGAATGSRTAKVKVAPAKQAKKQQVKQHH